MEKRNLLPIIVHNGNFKSNNLYDISPDYEGDIVIHGNLCLKMDVSFKGGLWVEGNISIEGNIEAEYIYAAGYMEADEIRVGDLQCNGLIMCTSIISAGDLNCKIIDSSSICVAGDFICSKAGCLHGDEFKVGGKFYCPDFRSKYKDTIEAEPDNGYCE